MKQLLTLLLLLFSFSGFSQGGFLNRVKQKVKDKVEYKADEKVDEGIDKGLDETENGIETTIKNSTAGENNEHNTQKKTAENNPAKSTSFQSYSRYDFVPGAQMVYAEDFSQDVIGEFPLLWATNNHGEVVTVKNQPGQWLRMFHTGHFAGPQLKKLPENFTVEFDMVLTFPNEGYVYPSIRFKLLQSPGTDKDGRYYLANADDIPQTTVSINPGEEESSTIEMNTSRGSNKYFNAASKPLKQLSSDYGKPFHVAIWVQKTRFRMWMNGEKIYDIPQAIPADMSFNRLAIDVTSYFSDEEKIGVYATNIRVAEGAADVRNKLITEGNWTTNGIIFDVASDKIKPESSGVLKEIANTLKENPSVKIKIIGHTDSDGDDAQNLDLSKRRAAAVKDALIKDFQVEESRMQTDGMGETKPVADNKLKEGKAQNRRVEFIKLP